MTRRAQIASCAQCIHKHAAPSQPGRCEAIHCPWESASACYVYSPHNALTVGVNMWATSVIRVNTRPELTGPSWLYHLPCGHLDSLLPNSISTATIPSHLQNDIQEMTAAQNSRMFCSPIDNLHIVGGTNYAMCVATQSKHPPRTVDDAVVYSWMGN